MRKLDRKITDALLQWKHSKNRMPLIVNGARQIGKTYSILEFGKAEYQNVVHVNLEKNKLAATIFEVDLTPSVLVQKLEAFVKDRILRIFGYAPIRIHTNSVISVLSFPMKTIVR
jgi:predicted AAA+ superfamily ATPase